MVDARQDQPESKAHLPRIHSKIYMPEYYMPLHQSESDRRILDFGCFSGSWTRKDEHCWNLLLSKIAADALIAWCLFCKKDLKSCRKKNERNRPWPSFRALITVVERLSRANIGRFPLSRIIGKAILCRQIRLDPREVPITFHHHLLLTITKVLPWRLHHFSIIRWRCLTYIPAHPARK